MCAARLAVSVLALVGILVSPPVLAQDWSQPWADPMDRPPRVDLSASAGFLIPTSWSRLELLGSIAPGSGVLEQVLTRELRVEPDTQFSAAATYWRGRYGFRVQAGYSHSSLTIGALPGGSTQAPASTADATSVGIRTWLYDVRAAIGFIEYAPTQWVWPYGFVGVGGITYDLKKAVTPPLTFIQGGVPTAPTTGNTVVVVDGGREFLLSVDELRLETVPALNVGIGTDFRLPLGRGGVGLRIEASDHIARSPLGVQIQELSPLGVVVADGAGRYGLVHHLSATAGIVVQIGR
jgi:hypothetical protein